MKKRRRVAQGWLETQLRTMRPWRSGDTSCREKSEDGFYGAWLDEEDSSESRHLKIFKNDIL